MFGVFRTILALFVVISHLFGPFQLGMYAVFGFYVLSGYLMTYVMNNSYGYSFNGRKRFVINRFLRIYPAYYAAILISVLLLFVFGSQITEFKSTIFLPSTLKEYLQNIFLIFPEKSALRLSPATWALTVELFFYLCICIGVSKNRFITWLWVCVSITITIYKVSQGHDWTERYFPISAASLPFSFGALMFHYKDFILKKFRQFNLNKPILWICILILNFLTSLAVENLFAFKMVFSIGFYLNLLIISCCIIALINYKPSFLTKNLDSAIGNYSYPIYLIHWQCGAFIYAVSEKYLKIEFASIKGVLFLMLSIILSFAVSYLIIQFIDMPIEKVRKYIKRK